MDETNFHRLARYNGERGRGIVHTDEWREAMSLLQEEWDAERREEMTAQGGHEVVPGIWHVPTPKKRRWRDRLR